MELLTPGIGLIIWQTFVFLLLVLLLAKLAWKPILNSLNERETSIQTALDTAEKARLEMSQLKSENEKLLKEAREERDRMLREAREVGAKLKEEAQADAKKAADKIIGDAREAINIEKQAALKEVKVQVALFSLEVAEKLMKKNLSDDKAQKDLVDGFIKELKLNSAMADIRVASRYVKSLLGLAVEQGVLDQVDKDMQLFDKVCTDNRAFAIMLKSPIIRHEKKLDILTKLFQGKVNKLTMAILEIITKKNREPLLPAIAKEFHNAYNVYKNVGKASIITAAPLDAKLRAEIEAIAKKLSDKNQVEISEKVNKDLIGGFVLNVGDKQIDTSIKTKLRTLRTKFSENPYVKEL